MGIACCWSSFLGMDAVRALDGRDCPGMDGGDRDGFWARRLSVAMDLLIVV